MTHQQQITIHTSGHGDMHDLTEQVSAAVAASGIQTGTVNVFNVGSTAAVGTVEFEPGWPLGASAVKTHGKNLPQVSVGRSNQRFPYLRCRWEMIAPELQQGVNASRHHFSQIPDRHPAMVFSVSRWMIWTGWSCAKRCTRPIVAPGALDSRAARN